MATPMSFSRLKKAIADNETDLIDLFLRTWNQSTVRDWRPSFGALNEAARRQEE
jgi:hypothetical protein